MTHIKTTKAKKDFVIKAIKKIKPTAMNKIYLATEKAIGFKHGKKNIK
jgi:hypothetical protein